MARKNEKIELTKGGKNVNDVFVPNDRNIGNEPMSAEDLSADERPFQIKSAPMGTEAPALEGLLESNTDAFTANLAERRKQSETKKNTSLADLINNRLGTKGETELTAEKYAAQGGADDIQVELDAINQDILAEQNALRRTKERYEEGGGLEGGAASEIQNAERTSLRKQADMYIKQMGIQGRFDSAKAIADRAIAVQLEKDVMRNEILKTVYEDNKDQFTIDEQREFQSAQNDRERKLDEKKTDLDRKYALVLDAQQNGAPSSVIQGMLDSATATDALRSGGNYIGLLDREAKRASIASSNTNRLLALASAGDATSIKTLGFDPRNVQEEIDPTTRRQQEDKLYAGKNLIDLATKYKNLVDTYGYENTVIGNQNIAGQYRALRGQITAAYKDAKTLGTLDKGVLQLMEGIIGEEPTSGAFTFGANFFGGKSNRIVNQLDELIETTSTENAQAALRLGLDPMAYDLLNEEELGELDALLGDAELMNEEEFDANSFYK